MSGMASFASPSAFAAEIAQISAQNVDAHNFDIVQDYRNQIQSASEAFGTNTFLTAELRNMPLDRIPHLTSTQLMQLLHHPERVYVESAQRTLASRDGFQEPHMRLAWRLYHPVASVRQEIVGILPHTPNIRPEVWLMALLDDPSDDVRLRTAEILSTTDDPALRRILIDRGMRDRDARIVGIANRLNEPQRTFR